jgi:hypothetical protein
LTAFALLGRSLTAFGAATGRVMAAGLGLEVFAGFGKSFTLLSIRSDISARATPNWFASTGATGVDATGTGTATAGNGAAAVPLAATSGAGLGATAITGFAGAAFGASCTGVTLGGADTF